MAYDDDILLAAFPVNGKRAVKKPKAKAVKASPSKKLPVRGVASERGSRAIERIEALADPNRRRQQFSVSAYELAKAGDRVGYDQLLRKGRDIFGGNAPMVLEFEASQRRPSRFRRGGLRQMLADQYGGADGQD